MWDLGVRQGCWHAKPAGVYLSDVLRRGVERSKNHKCENSCRLVQVTGWRGCIQCGVSSPASAMNRVPRKGKSRTEHLTH